MGALLLLQETPALPARLPPAVCHRDAIPAPPKTKKDPSDASCYPVLVRGLGASDAREESGAGLTGGCASWGCPPLPPACPAPVQTGLQEPVDHPTRVSIHSKPCQESAPCQVQLFKVPLQGHSVCLIGLLIKSLMFLSLL